MDELDFPLDDIVSLSEAASHLGVSPSTISRDVARGVIPNRGTVRAPKVSISEARAARAAHLDPARPGRSAPAPAATGYQAHRTTHEAIKSKRAALELAKMEGELIRVVDMEDFSFIAARHFRDSLLRRWRNLAVEFEGRTSREIEAKGLAADEALLNALATELESGLAGAVAAARAAA